MCSHGGQHACSTLSRALGHHGPVASLSLRADFPLMRVAQRTTIERQQQLVGRGADAGRSSARAPASLGLLPTTSEVAAGCRCLPYDVVNVGRCFGAICAERLEDGLGICKLSPALGD